MLLSSTTSATAGVTPGRHALANNETPPAPRRAVPSGRCHAYRPGVGRATPLGRPASPQGVPSWGAPRGRSAAGEAAHPVGRRVRPAPLSRQAGSSGVLEAKQGGSPSPGRSPKLWYETSTDAVLDDLGAADTITELLDACMRERGVEDADNSHPFTVFMIFHVPANKTLQFETWVQQTIALQAQRFPGYRGTLIYRPDSNIQVRRPSPLDSSARASAAR